MVGPKLNIKFKDALKLVMKQSWLGMIPGIGLSLYSGHLRADTAPIIISSLVFVLILSTFIVSNIQTEALTVDGIKFKEPFRDEKTIEWNQIVEVRNSSSTFPNYVSITCLGKDKPISVHINVFSYSEVSNWIKRYSPENHPLRKFCK